MLQKIPWVIRYFAWRIFAGGRLSLGAIGRPVFVVGLKRLKLGRNVRVFPGCRIEIGPKAEISIGDNVSIGHGLHITAAGSILELGADTVISSSVLITDNDHRYEDIEVAIAAQPLRINKTTIGRNCFIGSGAKILPGTTLGDHCIVGANAVVRGDFSSFSVISGIPAKVVKVLDQGSGEWKRI